MEESMVSKDGADESRLVSFVEKLIEFKTTEDRPEEKKKCLDCLVERFGKSLKVQEYQYRDRPLVVFSNTSEKATDVILAGHIDVVPGADGLFAPREADGKIFGRGAIDMKAAMAACLWATEEYVSSGGKKPVAVVVTSDEEIDGLSTKWLAEEIGYSAKLAILPDGGDERELVLRQKGFWQIKVTIQGKSAHASWPWEGENPIEKGFALFSHLEDRFPRPTSKEEWISSIALTKIEAGNALNQIPESATFYLDIRYTNENTREDIRSAIRNFLGEQSSVETVAENGALLVDISQPEVVNLKGKIEGVLGKEARFVSECGTSDAIFFAERGTPAVLFRPRGDGMHQAVEWVDRNSLVRFKEVIRQYLDSL